MDEHLEKFFAHYGVVGMKWGVRKKRGTPSADAERHKALRKKSIDELSDKELKEVVNRLNMQTNFNRMNPSKVKRGQAALAGLLAIGATVNAAIAFSKSPAGQAMSTVLFRAGITS